jgi:hypothetical protein
MTHVGKMMIYFGVAFIIVGLLIQVLGKLPGVGRLPGDFFVKKGSFTFYFPLATCLLASIVLSLVLSFFWRR